MAIQLHEADRSSIFSYVSAEVEMTLFISGDVQCYGVESPTVSVYRIGSWDAVVMLFDDTACLYSRSGSFDVQDVVRLLGDHHIVRVSGKDADIRTLGGVMPLRMKPMTLCQLDRNAPLSGFLDPSVVVRRLSSSDMKENLSLLLGIEEFRDTYQGKDPDREQAQLVKGLAHGDIRFGLYKGGRLCAVAGSTSCGPQSAMLIGVATRKEERGQRLRPCGGHRSVPGTFPGRTSVRLPVLGQSRRMEDVPAYGIRPRWSVHHGVSLASVSCHSNFPFPVRYLPSSLLQNPMCVV
jgi:predicted GNAT family acetyltransferase